MKLTKVSKLIEAINAALKKQCDFMLLEPIELSDKAVTQIRAAAAGDMEFFINDRVDFGDGDRVHVHVGVVRAITRVSIGGCLSNVILHAEL